MIIDKNKNRPYSVEEYNPEWMNIDKLIEKMKGQGRRKSNTTLDEPEVLEMVKLIKKILK